MLLWLVDDKGRPRVISANAKLGTRPSAWPEGWDWPSEATHWQPLPNPPIPTEGNDDV